MNNYRILCVLCSRFDQNGFQHLRSGESYDDYDHDDLIAHALLLYHQTSCGKEITVIRTVYAMLTL